MEDNKTKQEPQGRPWTVRAKGLKTYEIAAQARKGLESSGKGTQAKIKYRRLTDTFDVVVRDQNA